jgi:hypothetical protein
MLTWFKSLLSGKEAEELAEVVPDNLPPEVAGLNFQSAIEAHLRWKTRLSDLVNGRSNEAIDADALARDDKCVLGQWIHSVGDARYGSNPEFTALRSLHAAFHRHAGDVARMAHGGNHAQARTLLDTGPYAKASVQVVRQLAILWRKLG